MIDARLDRIGIVMMSAVGDAVHVLPVVNAIKRQRPAAHVTWIVQPPEIRMAASSPSDGDNR